jgi:hypothetical protein
MIRWALFLRRIPPSGAEEVEMRRPTSLLLIGFALLFAASCNDSMPTEPGGNPAWLDALIAQIEAEPVTAPPTTIYSYRYQGDTVYFRTSRCCDIRSVVYDEEGAVLCEPEGGVDGGGDGRRPDFLTTRSDERLVFLDPRD